MSTPTRKKISLCSLALVGLALFAASLNTPALAAPAFQLTPFPTPTPGPDGRILYEVQPNDTLLRISLISGVSIDEIRALNNFTGDNIRVGQQLLLGLGGPSQVSPTPGPSPTPTAVLPTPSPKPGSGMLCVALFLDSNGDSIRQDTEAPMSDGAISVSDRSGAVSLTAQTDGSLNEDGTDAECFENLPEGDYTVSVAIPEGNNPTTVTSYAIELKAGDQTFIDFGAQPNSEAVAQAPTPAGSGSSPLLGIVGGLLLAAGAGLAVVAARVFKAR